MEFAAVLERVRTHPMVRGAITRATAWDNPTSSPNERQYKCSQTIGADCGLNRQCKVSASTKEGRMNEVDVLLELERKLNAHAADHPLYVECAEASAFAEVRSMRSTSRGRAGS